eukprot:TRINITY_DN246_c0_g1_i1.p1 TRINITY_DN246_c0_g1~~TRINITY_DN246_c0_g1_i1.p1  ORF type:complete len:490 (+),score=115.71 TRINITY_DN246_c0_g1_i1:60-1472(+)
MAETVDASRVAEHHESREGLEKKVDTLKKMVEESKYTVFYTGAGVSTSAGVGDYRGPSGAWTQRRIAQLRRENTNSAKAELQKLLDEQAKEKQKATKNVGSLDAQPTFCHMAIAKMIQTKRAHYCITTNLDGIFRKAGLKQHTELCFLHGDIYTERCTGCGYDFERNYETRRSKIHVHDHHVGQCSRCHSKPPSTYTGVPLPGSQTGADADGYADNHLIGTRCKNVGTKDTHINFGECLDSIDWKEADQHSKKADLCIVMGTSMSLRHITHFPFQAKKTVIINLQQTPDDKKCDLRIWATCDDVMSTLFDKMGLEIDEPPIWIPKDYIPIQNLKAMGVHSYYIAAAERLENHIKKQQQRQAAAQAAVPAPAPAPRPEVSRDVTISTTAAPIEDRFRWSIKTEGGDIRSVTYHLHPTFSPSSITVTEAPFEISRVGWGTFTIKVDVLNRAGVLRQYRHELSLSGPTSVTHQ